jgi:hypothetical protein
MQENATKTTRVTKYCRGGKHCGTCRVAEFEFLNDCPMFVLRSDIVVQFPHHAANVVNNFRIEIVARCETVKPRKGGREDDWR